MPDDSYRTIRKLLASTNPDELSQGLDLAAIEIAKIGSAEARPLFEMVSTLYYIDAFDHPELVPAIDKAIRMAVGFGSWVIPVLMKNLDSGDIKAQWAIANVLGRIGDAAIKPLMMEYATTASETTRAFIIYALGKVKSITIIQAAAIVLDAAQSPNLELRDTATRSLGKLVESIPPENLSKEQKRQFIECLRSNLSDPNASVRSKAIRSLGKLARFGHLTDTEREQLRVVCRHLAGIDEEADWDRAFIVRKEAEEALRCL
jgi:HEAT repeat protein